MIDKDEVIAELVHILSVVVTQLTVKEDQQMALGEDILAAITREETAIDSIIALLNGLAPRVIPQATADMIISTINADRERIEAAVLANTPPPPPGS